MSHTCKCGQIFFSFQTLRIHQAKTDCMLEKYSVVDLYLTAKKVNEQEASDFVKRCYTEIVAAMKKGDYYASVEYTPMLGRLKEEVMPRVKKLFAGIRIRPDTETKTLDFEWGADDVINAEESVTPAIFDMECFNMKLEDILNKLASIESLKPQTPWSDWKKANFIDTIMGRNSLPHMYLLQDDTGLHCLKGYNRICALLDYMSQKATAENEPFAWHPTKTKEDVWNKWIGKKETKPQSGTCIYYLETPDMAAYVSGMNAKENGITYRFMTDEERTKFVNYMLPICIIQGNLTDEERDFIDKKLLNDEDISQFRIASKNSIYDKEDLEMYSVGLKNKHPSKKLYIFNGNILQFH